MPTSRSEKLLKVLARYEGLLEGATPEQAAVYVAEIAAVRAMLEKIQTPAAKPELWSDSNLPPPETERWTVARKAAVVEAVNFGFISLEQACQRYRLSEEEFRAWEASLRRHGTPGLRTTRVQIYRDTER